MNADKRYEKSLKVASNAPTANILIFKQPRIDRTTSTLKQKYPRIKLSNLLGEPSHTTICHSISFFDKNQLRSACHLSISALNLGELKIFIYHASLSLSKRHSIHGIEWLKISVNLPHKRQIFN